MWPASRSSSGAAPAVPPREVRPGRGRRDRSASWEGTGIAVFGEKSGTLDAADAELDAVEADLALARCRIAHERLLRKRAEHPGGTAGEDPYEQELFERAVRFYRKPGDTPGEGRRCSESACSRLRGELGFLPGVAANMVGPVCIAAASGRRDEAPALIGEASVIAEISGTHALARRLAEARTRA